MKLKVLSWNIWFDNDFEKVCNFLKEFDADVVGCGEALPNDPTRDIVSFMKGLGYHHILAPVVTLKKDGRIMSNALFSKYPIKESLIHILPDTKTDTRNMIQADIDIEGNALHVFVTHLLHTHQMPDPVQDSQVDKMLEILPRENTIVMGDINNTPESSIIKKMREHFHDAQLDPIMTVDPNLFFGLGCSTCKAEDFPMLRLDYIFTSSDMKASGLTVHPSSGSDHLPISTDIEI